MTRLTHQIPIKNKIAAERHLKVAPFRKNIRMTRPHKHQQYFELVFLSEGKGTHWIDGLAYEVNAPVIFFINREQTHSWNLSAEPDGFVAILKNSFLQHSRDDALKQLLHRVWQMNCLYLKDPQPVEGLFRLLTDLADDNSENNRDAIDGLLKAIIATLLDNNADEITHRAAPSKLYLHYLEMLCNCQGLHNSIGHYARILNVTPHRLNAACRRSVNRTASEILDDFITNEAQRLLLYTDNNVNEIAHLLNFKDTSYFIKFFKKYRQATPDEFRKSALAFGLK